MNLNYHFNPEPKHYQYALILFFLGMLYLVAPVFLGILAIAVVDFALSYLVMRKIDFGVDIMSIGLIYISYFHGIKYAFILLPFTILSRIMLGKIQIKHFIKFFVSIVCIIAAASLTSLPFITASFGIIIFRYIIDGILNILISGKNSIFEKAHHLFSTLIFLYFISWFF